MLTRSILALLLSACTYDARFGDCAVHCATSEGCPSGLVCGSEKRCRPPGGTGTCLGDAGTDALPTFPSCVGLAASCGPAGTDDCCSTATPIPGGTYYRSYDIAADGMYPDMSHPATVSTFKLDKYEVTVGRFRKFVEAGMGTQMSPPVGDTGAHAKIPGSGWDATWDAQLAADSTALVAAVKCHATWQTWTDAPGTNEDLPMNCVTWYEAAAFCAWDDGYLPTEAEWNYAASGGDEQRAYPWSSPAGSTTIDCTHADYDSASCVNGTNRVGSESPKGDGKWEQSDLAGNVWEWTLDWSDNAYPTPCNDCAALTSTASRVFRGGSYLNDASTTRVGNRFFYAPSFRGPNVGVRCARSGS